MLKENGNKPHRFPPFSRFHGQSVERTGYPLSKRIGLLVRRDMGQQHKEKCLVDGICRADAERAGPGGDGK